MVPHLMGNVDLPPPAAQDEKEEGRMPTFHAGMAAGGDDRRAKGKLVLPFSPLPLQTPQLNSRLDVHDLIKRLVEQSHP